MNRRSFIESVLKCGVAATILPSALTYSRRWVKPSESLLYKYYWLDPTCGSITRVTLEEWVNNPPNMAFECAPFWMQSIIRSDQTVYDSVLETSRNLRIEIAKRNTTAPYFKT